MNKITLGVLLTLSFSGYAATEQFTSTLIDSFKIESNFHFPRGINTLNVHQNVTVYSFSAKSIAAIKKTLAENEQKGFSTATASLSGLEKNRTAQLWYSGQIKKDSHFRCQCCQKYYKKTSALRVSQVWKVLCRNAFTLRCLLRCKL